MGVSIPPLQETGSRWVVFVSVTVMSVCLASAVGVLTATAASD